MTSESMLDGNVLAGTLRDVFSFEATAAIATCAGCGNRAPVADWLVFVNAPGIVARCANCEKVQMRIVHDAAGHMWLDLSGVDALRVDH
jgi:ABC-type uncharacterized transport system auxiliary subunit